MNIPQISHLCELHIDAGRKAEALFAQRVASDPLDAVERSGSLFEAMVKARVAKASLAFLEQGPEEAKEAIHRAHRAACVAACQATTDSLAPLVARWELAAWTAMVQRADYP